MSKDKKKILKKDLVDYIIAIEEHVMEAESILEWRTRQLSEAYDKAYDDIEYYQEHPFWNLWQWIKLRLFELRLMVAGPRSSK